MKVPLSEWLKLNHHCLTALTAFLSMVVYCEEHACKKQERLWEGTLCRETGSSGECISGHQCLTLQKKGGATFVHMWYSSIWTSLASWTTAADQCRVSYLWVWSFIPLIYLQMCFNYFLCLLVFYFSR